MFGIKCSLPTKRRDVDTIKGVNTTRLSEGSSPKGFCPIDEQSEALQVGANRLGSLGRYNDVITEHEYSTGLMKPTALQ
jgi:hypothetical protein